MSKFANSHEQSNLKAMFIKKNSKTVRILWANFIETERK